MTTKIKRNSVAGGTVIHPGFAEKEKIFVDNGLK